MPRLFFECSMNVVVFLRVHRVPSGSLRASRGCTHTITVPSRIRKCRMRGRHEHFGTPQQPCRVVMFVPVPVLSHECQIPVLSPVRIRLVRLLFYSHRSFASEGVTSQNSATPVGSGQKDGQLTRQDLHRRVGLSVCLSVHPFVRLSICPACAHIQTNQQQQDKQPREQQQQQQQDPKHETGVACWRSSKTTHAAPTRERSLKPTSSSQSTHRSRAHTHRRADRQGTFAETFRSIDAFTTTEPEQQSNCPVGTNYKRTTTTTTTEL